MRYVTNPPRLHGEALERLRLKIVAWSPSGAGSHSWSPTDFYVPGGRRWECGRCHMMADVFFSAPWQDVIPTLFDLEEGDWGCPGYDVLQFKRDCSSVRRVMEV